MCGKIEGGVCIVRQRPSLGRSRCTFQRAAAATRRTLLQAASEEWRRDRGEVLTAGLGSSMDGSFSIVPPTAQGTFLPHATVGHV